MEIRRLRYFAAVSAEGSFHRAATKLNIAASALSRQIRELEEDLKVTLFIRSARGVSLSPAGEVLGAEVKALLAQMEQARTRTQRAAVGQFGLVKIGLATAVAEMPFVIAAYADVQRSTPEVDFRLSLIDSDQHVQALIQGEIDVGVFHRRGPSSPEMSYRDLCVHQYKLLVSGAHRLAGRSRVRLAELQDERIIAPSASQWPRAHNEIMSACLRNGVNPRIVWDVNTEGVAVNLISQGLAVGFVSSSIAQIRQLEGCALLTVDELDLALHLAAVWRGDRETPAVVRLVDLLAEHAARTTASNGEVPARRKPKIN